MDESIDFSQLTFPIDIPQQSEPPPPPQTTVNFATNLINDLLQLYTNQQQILQTIREQQLKLFNSATSEAFNTLYQEEKNLQLNLQYAIQNLETLQQQCILTPDELHRVEFLENEFKLQVWQNELYIFEIEQLARQQRATKP